MIVDREDNSALYFIVGGLLVAVMAFAFFYFQGNSARNAPDTMVERSTIVERNAPADESSLNLSVGQDSTRATTTRESTR